MPVVLLVAHRHRLRIYLNVLVIEQWRMRDQKEEWVKKPNQNNTKEVSC